LHDPIEVTIAPVKVTTELVEQHVYHVAKADKTELLAGLIHDRCIHRAIVFTRTKHGADRVAQQLNKRGIKADAIHGNKSQNARQRALAGFKNDRMQVLVATDLAARGIDVDGVSYVFNYDLPHEPETYVHRIGRTGRAGASGIAVSFCDHEERKHLSAIERLTGRRVPVEMAVPEAAQVTLLAASHRPERDLVNPRGARPRRPQFGKKPARAFAGHGGHSGPHKPQGRGFTAGKGKRRPSASRW
jgi:ATP-dependent RNA helicase RhlE